MICIVLRPPPHRRGITVIEMLVVVGVIGILMALTLPAVQRSREAARIIQCRNNLHQIGVAIHSTHDMYGSIDTSKVLLGSLPAMEMASLREILTRIDGRPSVLPPGPQVYICPSDSLAIAAERHISYRINDGSTISHDSGIRPAGLGKMSFGEITDGLSATALMAEKLVSRLEPVQSEADGNQIPERVTWQTPVRFAPGQERELAEYCLDRQHHLQATLGVPLCCDKLVGFGAEAGYNHLTPPNNWTYNNGPPAVGIVQGGLGPKPAYSLHGNGVNVLMADGSVRFVPGNIDLSVWWAMGTKNGKEAVSVD